MASAFGDMAVESIQINHTLGLPSYEYQVKKPTSSLMICLSYLIMDEAIYQLSSQIIHSKTTHEPLDVFGYV